MTVGTYQTNHYDEQGGDKEVFGPGSTLDLQSGAAMFWASTSIDPREAELFFLGRLTVTQHASADISSGSVLSPAYGYHMLSAATGMSKASALLPTASYGALLVISGSYLVTDGNISITTVSTLGLLLNERGSDLSSFELSAGNYIEMIATADGTWNVVGTSNYTQHPSS